MSDRALSTPLDDSFEVYLQDEGRGGDDSCAGESMSSYVESYDSAP